MILFVLPAHTSHILQPLDIGCFGPLKSAYYKLCQLHLRRNPGQIITRYDICSISSRAHSKALTVDNVVQSFKDSGIYPYNPYVIRDEQLAPSLVTNPQPEMPSMPTNPSATTPTISQPPPTIPSEKSVDIYLQDKLPTFKAPLKPRRLCKRKSYGGQAITEDGVVDITKCPDKSSQPQRKKNKGKKNVPQRKQVERQAEPMPGPSSVQNKATSRNDPDSSSDTQDDDVCCQCDRFSPAGLKLCANLTIVNWAQCDQCTHWVHLRFCVPLMEVGVDDTFVCPCCASKEE